MNFKKWYKDPKHQKLFTEGGFKPHRGARYHSLVKRYNVFIEYYNGMNREFRGRGDISQEMQVCSDIIEKYQKVRYDQVKKNVKSGKSMLNDLVKKDETSWTTRMVVSFAHPRSQPPPDLDLVAVVLGIAKHVIQS